MKKILAGVVASAVLLSACGSSQEGFGASEDDNYVGVCTDGNGYRVDDDQCSGAGNDSGGFSIGAFVWGYILASVLMPSFGQRVPTNTVYRTDTNRNYYRGGVPRSGGNLDFKAYKPLTKTENKPKAGIKSDAYNQKFNKSPNYTKPSVKSSVKNNNSGSYNKPANKAPAPPPRRK